MDKGWGMALAGLNTPLPGSELPGRGSLALIIGVAVIGGGAVALTGWPGFWVCLSLLAGLLVFLDFRLGVGILIVMMPISASALFPHNMAGVTGLNPLNLLLLATFLAYLLRPVRATAIARLPPGLLWRYVLPLTAAALLGAGSIDGIPAYFQATGLIEFDSVGSYWRDQLFKPMLLIVFALLVGVAAARSPRLETLLWPMLLSVGLMGLMTIVFVYLSGASFSELASSRARAFFAPLGMHANDLGRCYAMAYALMLFTFAASRDDRLRLALLAGMAMLVLALVLTFSRGAFLGFAVVNVLFLLSRRRIAALLLGGLALVGLVLLLPGAVFERIGSGWGSGLNAISAGRVDEIWLPLLPEIGDSPLIGHGLGSILWSQAMRTGQILQVTHPHNAYLQAILDMGLIGLTLVLSYFALVWRRFRALSRDKRCSPLRQGFYEGAAVGLLSFLLTAFAGSSLLPVPEQSFLWFAIGMMYGEDGAREQHA